MATVLKPETTLPNGAPSARLQRKKKATPKKWLWPAIFGGVLILSYIIWTRTHAGAGQATFITAPVSRGDLVETVTATGSVEAQTGAKVNIGSQITGVIKKLYADVGSHVDKGQIIAELDLPDLQANYKGSQAAAAAAQSKYQQQLAGVSQQRIQTSTGIEIAQATLAGNQQKLISAQAAANQQRTATPADIERAKTALASAKAAVDTAKANLQQAQSTAAAQVQAAQEQYQQAQANAANSASLLQRNMSLYQQGYIAASVIDQAKATNDVNQSQVRAAQQNVQIVQQKVVNDQTSAKAALAQAQENVISAQAALTAANAETYTTAQRAADVKDAQAAVQNAQAALAAANANIANNVLKAQDVAQAKDAAAQAAAQEAYNNAQVQKSFIRSPISGTVLTLAAQQGETLAAGLSAPTVITVADLNRLEIDAYVSETDIGKVQIGQSADCTIDAFPSQTFEGTVQKIAAGSTIQQNVVTYDVTISIKDPQHKLRPDMTASVNIEVGKKSNVILVPSVAVQLGTNGSTVNVMKQREGKQVAVPVPVVTGGTDGVNTEIVSGLKDGDTIILAGATQRGSGRGPNNPFGPSSNRGGGGGRRGG